MYSKSIIYFLIIICLLFFCPKVDAKCLVIVNNSVSVYSISKAEIRRIFLGKQKRWPDGQPVKPVILKEGSNQSKCIKKFINKTASSFSSYWKRAIVSGLGIPPKSYETVEELVKYVSVIPGAVAFIPSGIKHESTKELLIIE